MIVIPIYDVAVIPHTNIYLSSEYYTRMSGVEPKNGAEVIFIFEKEDTPYKELNENSFEPIGVEGEIVEANNNGYIGLRMGDRVNVKSVKFENNALSVDTTERPDINDLTVDEERDALTKVKNALMETLPYFQNGNMYRNWIIRLRSVAEVIATSATWMSIEPEEKYAFIATDSRKERLSLYEKAIYQNIAAYKVSTEAENAQQGEDQKAYREQAIKKQMEFLQKELDDMHPENVSEVRKFEIKLNSMQDDMNEDARKEAQKALNRMKQEGQNSPEYGQLYNYLDFMTNLPWKKQPFKAIDLDHAADVLDADHFGLKKVKNRILQQIAVMNLNKKQTGSILLFVGAPGTGKTSIGQSIAKALDRKYERISLGGIRDEADIRGHRRTYIGAMPGRIMDAINKAGTSNPVMVLDEVDKLSSSYNGDPASALLEVLDPEQNFSFTDHYLNVPYDLSDVFFICTANSIDTIPEPLLNRMEVIQFNGYTPLEKQQIAIRHLLPKAIKEMGLQEDQIKISDDTIKTIVNDYTMEAGVRGLKKRMDTICRVAAIDIVKGNKQVEVTKDNLNHFLDMHPIIHDHVLKNDKPGIVTGLAWTQAGGEILFIETALTKGTGKVIITGQLGDVMKESAQIAISIVKSRFPEKADIFEKHDLHIHVPEGAVPKDGPSAGITLTTALSSLVNDKVVDPTIAMTGEVSLRQKVMPIGGLPEKLMAAQRAGVKTVFIPKDNVQDLDDVPEETKNALDIHPVETVEDVLKGTHIIDD